MKARVANYVLRAAALVGFAMSCWMLVQYLLPPSVSACGPHGGCNAVHACWLGQIGGELPFLPFSGILAYATLLFLTLSKSDFSAMLVPIGAVGAGLAGMGLIAAQKFVCHAFCPFCLVADAAGIAAAAAWFVARAPLMPAPTLVRVAFAVLAVGSVGGSFYWGVRQKTSRSVAGVVVTLPDVIAREQRPGVATLVDFADFECPYCRQQHAELREVLPSFGSRVLFVRKHVPLGMHPHAEDAARAACCAEEQGQREAMADALFTSDDLTPGGCAAIASRLSLDMTAYRACLAAPRTTDRLARDRTEATDADVRGLPTMFVGNERFDGVVRAGPLRESIERALEHSTGRGS